MKIFEEGGYNIQSVFQEDKAGMSVKGGLYHILLKTCYPYIHERDMNNNTLRINFL